MTQGNQFFIIMEYGILAGNLIFCVNFGIVGIYHDPGITCGKTGIFCVIPLHGSAGIVTALAANVTEHGFFIKHACLCQFFESIDTFNITQVIHAVKRNIGHTQLFTLINIRSTLHHVKHGCQHFRGKLTIFITVIAQAGQHTGLIMITPVKRIPCTAFQLGLPFAHNLFQIGQRNLLIIPFKSLATVQIHVLKLKYHIQFSAFAVGIFFCLFNGNTSAFTNCQQIIMGQYFFIHFLKIFMYMRAIAYIRTKITVFFPILRCNVRHSFCFGDHADYVHTETINAFIAPPGHHLENIVSHCGIFPVQIGLFLCKQMQVIHVRGFIIFPCRTAEAGSPVIGLMSVLAFSPDIIITFGIILGFAAFHKPLMFIRSMIDHQVHHDLNPMVMSTLQHAVIILHGTKFFHDCLIIADIIAIILIGRLINRRQPDHINTQLLQIIHFTGNTI